MKNKLWLKYLLYIIFIFILLALDRYSQFKATTHAVTSYNFVALLVTTFVNAAIGALLALEPLSTEAKKVGRWKFNWTRAIILLVPSLYIIICYYSLYFGKIIFRPIYYLYKIDSLKTGVDVMTVFRLLFGYWFTTCL